MDSSNDFLLGQEGSNGAYGPDEQVWLICPGQEHKTAVSLHGPCARWLIGLFPHARRAQRQPIMCGESGTRPADVASGTYLFQYTHAASAGLSVGSVQDARPTSLGSPP